MSDTNDYELQSRERESLRLSPSWGIGESQTQCLYYSIRWITDMPCTSTDLIHMKHSLCWLQHPVGALSSHQETMKEARRWWWWDLQTVAHPVVPHKAWMSQLPHPLITITLSSCWLGPVQVPPTCRATCRPTWLTSPCKPREQVVKLSSKLCGSEHLQPHLLH